MYQRKEIRLGAEECKWWPKVSQNLSQLEIKQEGGNILYPGQKVKEENVEKTLPCRCPSTRRAWNFEEADINGYFTNIG